MSKLNSLLSLSSREALETHNTWKTVFNKLITSDSGIGSIFAHDLLLPPVISEIEIPEAARLKAYAKDNKHAMSVMLLTICNITMYKITSNSNPKIGIMVADFLGLDEKRHLAQSVIPVLPEVDPNLEFKDYLLKFSKGLGELIEKSQYPLDRVKSELSIAVEDTFFDLFVTFDSQFFGTEQHSAVFPINVNFRFTEDRIFAQILLSRRSLISIETFAHYYQIISKTVLENPCIRLRLIKLCQENYEQSTYSMAGEVGTVNTILESIKDFGESAAIIDDKKVLSYHELCTKSTHLAQILVNTYGVKHGDMIAVRVEPSYRLVVLLSAVFKSGGIYVPVPWTVPDDRFNLIVEEHGIKFVISDNVDTGAPQHLTCQSILVEEFFGDVSCEVKQGLEDVSPDSGAYVIFTSGSTGVPKGVLVSHRSLYNFLNSIKLFSTGTSRVDMPLIASYGFDISLFEIFYPLICGGIFYVQGNQYESDIFKLVEKLSLSTAFHAVPSLMLEIVNFIDDNKALHSFGGVQQIFVGGEKVPQKLISRLLRAFPSANIYLLYGPTEGTIFCTMRMYNSQTTIDLCEESIGKSFSTVRVEIFDVDDNVLPIGCVGQIGITGWSVAMGYLNNPGLTNDSFFTNRLGMRYYKTGDYAKLLTNGELSFLGRRDSQIKVRGYRIELREIESQLQKIEGIDQVYLLYLEQRKFITAFFSGKAYDPDELRSILVRTLPSYMIPTYFMYLSIFPKNVNGKINREVLIQKLESMLRKEVSRHEADEVESRVLLMCQELLHGRVIDINKSFVEQGGHSLLTMQLLSRVYRDFNVRISLEEFFNASSILQLTNRIKESTGQIDHSITPIEEQEFFHLSHAQMGIWLMTKIHGNSSAYNIPVVYELTGIMDEDNFRKALLFTIARHNSLRTIFRNVGDGPRQFVLNHLEADRVYNVINRYGESFSTLQGLIEEFCFGQFELETGPLIRVHLIRTSNERRFLVFVIHHIISDAWSLKIIVEELISAYNGTVLDTPPLSPLPFQYTDFSAWHNELLGSVRGRNLERYWAGKLKEVRTFSYPPDFISSELKGAMVDFEVSKVTSEGFKEFCRTLRTTEFMGLMACWFLVLYKRTGCEDIIVGFPYAARDSNSLDKQVGYYINTIPLRMLIGKEESIESLVENTKIAIVEAILHSEYPFDLIVRDVSIDRNQTKIPLINIGFTWLDIGEVDLMRSLRDLSLNEIALSKVFIKNDLWLYGQNTEDGFKFSLTYNETRYARSTIVELANCLRDTLAQVQGDLKVSVSDIDLPLPNATSEGKDSIRIDLDI